MMLLFTIESTCANDYSSVKSLKPHSLHENNLSVLICPDTILKLDTTQTDSPGLAAITSFSVKISLAKIQPTQSAPTPKRISPASQTSQTESANQITNGFPTASTSSKRGIAYNDAAFVSAFSKFPKVSWAYNWADVTVDIPQSIEYVPMLWGLGEQIQEWHSHAENAILSGATHLLAFNEPDITSQANLTVDAAVAGYLEHMEPFSGRVKLGSPAVTNGGGHMGLSWLESFTSRCTSCTIDFIAIHWYDGGEVATFKDYVMKAHEVGGYRPVWITEFRSSGLGEDEKLFLEEVLPWLDVQDYIHRYAYFMASEGRLISGGKLSALGETFASFM